MYTLTDPLTLERIGIQPAFVIERYGVMHAYDACQLAKYIDQTGDFNDPQTRTPYASHELRRLDRLAGSVLSNTRDSLIHNRNCNEDRESLLRALYNELITTVEHSRMLVGNASIDVFKDVLMPIIVQSVDNLRVVDEGRSMEILHEVYNIVYDTFDASDVRDSLLILLYILRQTASFMPVGM